MSLSQHAPRINELLVLLKGNRRRIHILGIFGVSMSSLAEHLSYLGHTVTGSDDAISKEKGEHLFSLGISTDNSLKLENIAKSELIIASLAIPDSSEECNLARALGIPIYYRPELLGAFMKDYQIRIGISGTHGKSTTTAIIDRILTECGKSPTVFSGAPLKDGRAYRRGSDDIFLYEACEYKRAFLSFSPTVSIICGIELDHTDCYKSIDALEEAFFTSVTSAEKVVISNEYPACRRLIKRLGERAVTFGKRDADYIYSVKESTIRGTRFTLRCGESIRELYISSPGEHNVKNATAAIITADLLTLDKERVKDALFGFYGIPRRLEHIGKIGKTEIYYDYAHHPTELSAVIGTLQGSYKSLTVIFKPHTFTRTRDLWQSFVDSLSAATHSLILDIYPARESAIPGITAERLSASIPNSEYVNDDIAISRALYFEDEAILLSGAGDVEMIKKQIENIIKDE